MQNTSTLRLGNDYGSVWICLSWHNSNKTIVCQANGVLLVA